MLSKSCILNPRTTDLLPQLGLAAGFIGGLTSRYSGPMRVFAQASASPQEIRAQKFVLVDEAGVARVVFGLENNGTPQIEINGYKGHIYATVFRPWSMVHGSM